MRSGNDDARRPTVCLPRVVKPGLESLITAVQDGQAEAFSQLYDALVGHVWDCAIGLTGDPRRAEALTVACFVRVWRTLPRASGLQGCSVTALLALVHAQLLSLAASA